MQQQQQPTGVPKTQGFWKWLQTQDPHDVAMAAAVMGASMRDPSIGLNWAHAMREGRERQAYQQQQLSQQKELKQMQLDYQQQEKQRATLAQRRAKIMSRAFMGHIDLTAYMPLLQDDALSDEGLGEVEKGLQQGAHQRTIEDAHAKNLKDFTGVLKTAGSLGTGNVKADIYTNPKSPKYVEYAQEMLDAANKASSDRKALLRTSESLTITLKRQTAKLREFETSDPTRASRLRVALTEADDIAGRLATVRKEYDNLERSATEWADPSMYAREMLRIRKEEGDLVEAYRVKVEEARSIAGGVKTAAPPAPTGEGAKYTPKEIDRRKKLGLPVD